MKIIAICTLCLIAVNLFGQNPARIEFETTEINSGDIVEGTYQMFKFPFTNTGDSALIIKTVKSSCGCLVPFHPKNPIMPGQTDTVKGLLSTKGRLGKFVKSLTVISNDKANPMLVLRIRGMVVPFQGKLLFRLYPGSDILERSYYGEPELKIKGIEKIIISIENSDAIDMNIKILKANEPTKKIYGAFFSSEAVLPKDNNEIYYQWGDQFKDEINLTPNNQIYLIILFNNLELIRYNKLSFEINGFPASICFDHW